MTRQKPTGSKDAIDEGQSARFIEAARAAGVSEDEAVFDANLNKIMKAKSIGDTATGEPRVVRKGSTK